MMNWSLIAALCALVCLTATAVSQTQAGTMSDAEAGALGANHKQLEYFLGKWDAETILWMPGGGPMKTKGEVEYTWQFKDRWLAARMKSSMMGMPFNTFQLFGYDNFRRQYVWVGVDTMSTHMISASGKFTADGKNLLLYGSMNEPATGEVNKTVKYAFRIIDENRWILDVYDLVIGEENSQVFRMIFTRSGKTSKAKLPPPAPGTGKPPVIKHEFPDPQEMMAIQQKATALNRFHKYLEQFIGVDDVSLKMTVQPGAPPVEAKGEAKTEWILNGRVLGTALSFEVAGQKVAGLSLTGYDNFRRKYVSVHINDRTTAMVFSSGNWSPDGKSLVTYGYQDEPSTGEINKAVKFARRVLSPTSSVLEVHDLSLDEDKTKVVEVSLTRKK